jgi:prevent-host-death family protein
MKIAPLAEVKAHFSSYVEECEQGPVVVTKNGRPKAVLVAAGNEEELERLVLCPYAEIYGVAEGCGAANQERARTQARRLLAGSEESKIA